MSNLFNAARASLPMFSRPVEAVGPGVLDGVGIAHTGGWVSRAAPSIFVEGGISGPDRFAFNAVARHFDGLPASVADGIRGARVLREPFAGAIDIEPTAQMAGGRLHLFRIGDPTSKFWDERYGPQYVLDHETTHSLPFDEHGWLSAVQRDNVHLGELRRRGLLEPTALGTGYDLRLESGAINGYGASRQKRSTLLREDVADSNAVARNSPGRALAQQGGRGLGFEELFPNRRAELARQLPPDWQPG